MVSVFERQCAGWVQAGRIVDSRLTGEVGLVPENYLELVEPNPQVETEQEAQAGAEGEGQGARTMEATKGATEEAPASEEQPRRKEEEQERAEAAAGKQADGLAAGGKAGAA